MARKTGPTGPRHVTPTQLLNMLGNIKIHGSVAVDTETSGLWVDEGARVSTVSIAWVDRGGADGIWTKTLGQGQTLWPGGIVTVRPEPVYPDGRTAQVVSMAWPFDQGVAGTGKTEDNGQATLWPEADNLDRREWDALLTILRRLKLTMHHAKFDLHLLRAGCRRWPGVGADLIEQVEWDTQNGNSLLYSTTVTTIVQGERVATTSLKPTSKALWGDAEGDEQQVIRDYLRRKKLPAGRWDLMPWDVIGRYADDDARKTIRLRLRQEHDLETGAARWLDGRDGRLTAAAAIKRRLETTKMLTRMEQRGLPFDVAGALEGSRELQRIATELEDALPFKPATLPAAKRYWFGTGPDQMGLPPYETTGKGQPSLTEEIVRLMVRDRVPGAETWQALTKVNTMDSRWYAGYASMAGPDGRLRAGVRQNGTVSSRFSVERIQLQAIPHDYRLTGIPQVAHIPTPRTLIGRGVPPGMMQVELDLANAEARVAALFAKCGRMLDMFHAGVDVHSETAKALFHVKPDAPNWGKMRNVAKRGNFSFIFGVGWETFQTTVRTQAGINLTEDEARQIVRSWNALYPEYAQAIDRHSRAVEDRQRRYGYGWVGTVNGERRWFQQREETHKAFNQRVQANLAQFGIDWWLDIERYLLNTFGDESYVVNGKYIGRIGLVLVIHDSMVLLLPDNDQGHAAVEYAKRAGAELWASRFPGVPGNADAKRWGSD